jgi:hypothetical protein
MTRPEDAGALAEAEIITLLGREHPSPSQALRRRVRDRISFALGLRRKRAWAAGLITSGSVLLAVASVLALTTGG